MKKLIVTGIVVSLILSINVTSAFARFGNRISSVGIGNGHMVMNQNGNSENGGMVENHDIKRPRPHHNVIAHILHCLKDLEISDDTQEEIRNLIETYRDGMDDRKAALRDAELAYWEVLTAPDMDEAALEEAENAIIALRNENETLRFDLALNIRNLLSEDQLAALADCIDETVTEPLPDNAPPADATDKTVGLFE